MYNSIFTKSLYRQPIRLILFMLLIALSTFTVTMRGVEYLVVANNIQEIGKFYRAVGFLNSREFENWDVLLGAKLIAEDSLVKFEDRRRGYAGILKDMLNSDIGTTSFVNFASFTEGFTDAFFYGTLLDKSVDDANEIIILTILIDEVVQGYPEHVVGGQTLTLHFYPNELLEELYIPSPFYAFGALRAIDVLHEMEIGERYFLRGVLHNQGHRTFAMGPPQVGRQDDVLAMRPLNEVATSLESYRRKVVGEEIWYLPVPAGEVVDFSTFGLESVEEEIERLRIHQSTIFLETTVDMNAVPYTQPAVGVHQIIEGRGISREDHLEMRPVAVINDFFAHTRDIQLGDMLTISIPNKQYKSGRMVMGEIGNIMVTEVYQFAVPHQKQSDLLLEVEVIGLYQHLYAVSASTARSNLIYIPDSLLPGDLPLYQWAPEVRGGSYLLGVPGVDFQFPFWYSFVLEDPRDESIFLLEHEEQLASMGINVNFVPTQAAAFWDSADGIIQSVEFNLVIFGILVILVLTFTVFLYLWQSRKQFAVARALGISNKILLNQQSIGMLCFSLPALVMGGIGGWFFALSEASNTLNPLLEFIESPEEYFPVITGEVAVITGVEMNIELPIYWLVVFILLLLFAIYMVVALVGRQMSRYSVLELLQGETKGKRTFIKRDKVEIDCHSNLQVQDETVGINTTSKTRCKEISMLSEGNSMNRVTTSEKKKNDIKRYHSSTRFIFCQIIRSKGKTILTIVIASFFIIALTYLQEAILRGEVELENLYETTAVTAEIRQVGQATTVHRNVRNMIAPRTIRRILDSGFVRNEFIEATHEYAVVIPAINGQFPENWEEIVGIDLNESILMHFDQLNSVLGLNDLKVFITTHSRDFLDELAGAPREFLDGTPMGDMEINFASGFEKSSFAFSEGSPIPVLMSQEVMGLWVLDYGDIIYIGTTYYDTGRWKHIRGQVIGSHNRNITIGSERLLDATLMPLEGLEYLLGQRLGYATFQFEIDPAYSRDIHRVSDYLTNIVRDRDAGWTELNLTIRDEELRMVAAPMEQNLSILRLLYPVMIGISIVIGFGLSMILMLQSAKNAAIMRVLGEPRRNTRVVLIMEKLLVCLLGLLIGVMSMLLSGWGFGLLSAVGLVGLYLTGVITGLFVGAVFITNRPTLSLLQVRE